MKERPILFSAPMVRAILEGRKTQTRRIISWREAGHQFSLNPHTTEIIPVDVDERFPGATAKQRNRLRGIQWESRGPVALDKLDSIAHYQYFKCPYGQPGDLLWCKETWRTAIHWNDLAPNALPISNDLLAPVNIDYVADGTVSQHGKTRTSIHMPRWASRIDLEITSVRAERLKDMTEDDALSEGVQKTNTQCARAAFKDLWTSIHGSWNPYKWVWVIEFKRI